MQYVMFYVQTGEFATSNSDDLLATIMKLQEEHPDFLIEKDLEDTSPFSLSDSGLSSAQSLSYEQQLSPLLSIGNEDEQIEIMNSNLNSPQDLMDFEPVASPIHSLSSVDSPVRSVMSSNIGSPATDVAEEVDYGGQTLVAVVTPNNSMPNTNTNATIVTEQPAVVIGKGARSYLTVCVDI